MVYSRFTEYVDNLPDIVDNLTEKIDIPLKEVERLPSERIQHKPGLRKFQSFLVSKFQVYFSKIIPWNFVD